MTSGAVTIANAPRTTEQLQVVGPFMLKRLMEEASKTLNIDFGEERKGAFLRDPIDKRAKDVLELLLQIDKAGGGAPAPTPAPAAAAKEEKAEKPKREPRPAPTTNGTTSNGASHAGGSEEQEGMKILSGIASVIKEVSGSLEAMQKNLAQVEKGSKRIDTLETTVQQMFRLQHLQMGVLLMLAENQLGTTSANILGSVGDEYSTVEKTVTEMVAGK